MKLPVIKFLTEAWDRGVCHYYEDDTIEIAINKYKFKAMDADGDFHVLIDIDGRLKYNDYLDVKTWEEAEKWAVEKARELYE